MWPSAESCLDRVRGDISKGPKKLRLRLLFDGPESILEEVSVACVALVETQ